MVFEIIIPDLFLLVENREIFGKFIQSLVSYPDKKSFGVSEANEILQDFKKFSILIFYCN
jgi:hypothetical protein